ncbi:MAG: Hsp70 family protein [Oscillospiraceae bacterium]|nr:Hsp70 family protein [Oscillospiraceae bacterium]
MRVGIDLGTTNTVASYIDENGIWNCLEFRQGREDEKRFLPSVVAAENGRICVGAAALDAAMRSPGDVIYDAKANMPTPGKEYFIGGISITAQEASTQILREVYRELKDRFPSEKSFNAFVTVPTGFMTEARIATKTALRNAGFETNEDCLTDEPIAAAVSYSTRLDGDRLVLVVDMGGGTFDLSLLKTSIIGASVGADRLEPVGHGRDMHLGGNDVDDLLVHAMSLKFIEDGGTDLDLPLSAVYHDRELAAAVRRMRELTLDIKKQLYSGDRAFVFVRDLYGGADLDFSITQAEYAMLMTDLAARYKRCIDNTFVGIGYTVSDVDHVIMAGGMAHETVLLGLLSSMFGRDRIIIPDDAMYMVSKGAAICNSDIRLRVENRSYTTIGLLRDSGRGVEVLIREGEIIRTGQILTAEITPASKDATAINIQIAEFTGEFDPSRYTVILSGNVPVMHRKISLPFMGKHPIILKARFSEDKILSVTVIQGKRKDRLDVRLGGK